MVREDARACGRADLPRTIRVEVAQQAGDLLAVVAAEDAFDVRDRLHAVRAPTLVLGGALDGFYSTALFVGTADAIPRARLVLRPRCGHAGALTHRSAGRAVATFLAGDEE